jgi:hypothetical protein
MDYQKTYDSIISNARKQTRFKLKKTNPKYVYYEAHHIIPKCLGGDGKASDWRWHSNIVLLTSKEHFICHRLLSKIYPKNPKIIRAFLGMCNKRYDGYKPSARVYEEAKKLKNELGWSEEARKKQSDAKKGVNNPSYGKHPTKETLEKMSRARLGIKKPKEVVERRLKTWKANGNSEKTTKRLSKKLLHVESGIVYESYKAVAKAFNIRPDTVTRRVARGLFKNIEN